MKTARKIKKYILPLMAISIGLNTVFTFDVKAENKIVLAENINLDYSSLRKQIEDYIYNNQDLKEAYIAVAIKDLNNNQAIYSLNADKTFIPASNMKVFTTLLSLEKLGADYKFSTKVLTDGFIENGELKGNLYFNFVGDPTFKSEDLKKMLIEIKNMGVDKISGNVFIDRSAFDNIFYGPGWMWDDMDSCDSSPIDAFYLDDNCLKVHVIASDKKVYTHTDNNIEIDTSGVTIVKDKVDNIKIDSFKDNRLKISGSLGDNKTTEIEQSISQPDIYIEGFLQPLLRKYFSYNKTIELSNSPKNLKTLSENLSQPLSEILKRFNKESHNLTGELLIKTIALNDNKTQGSTKKGVEIMKDYLKKTFSYSDFNIVDGSGLSRYNLVSPAMIMDALSYIYKNSAYRNIVMDAFPVGGKDGTLKNRLKKLKGYQVIAKSGSMTGVNCLSGYLVGDKGQNYSFSIMINNANISGKALRDFQDNILYMVTDYKS